MPPVLASVTGAKILEVECIEQCTAEWHHSGWQGERCLVPSSTNTDMLPPVLGAGSCWDSRCAED